MSTDYLTILIDKILSLDVIDGMGAVEDGRFDDLDRSGRASSVRYSAYKPPPSRDIFRQERLNFKCFIFGKHAALVRSFHPGQHIVDHEANVGHQFPKGSVLHDGQQHFFRCYQMGSQSVNDGAFSADFFDEANFKIALNTAILREST